MHHPDFHFNFDYRPVGQGLFASGSIHRRQEDAPCFTWVYDCGSSDSSHCLTREIDRLARDLGAYSKIDVLILSHFDRDHINGVSKLLRMFRVDRLIVPYLPIEDRLAIVLTTPHVTFDYIQALIDPARYFHEVAGDKLGQVAYVQGGGHEEPPLSSEGPVPPELPPEGPLGEMVKYPRDSAIDSPDGEYGADEGNVGQVVYTTDKEPLCIPGLWELVFFNKESKRATPKLIKDARTLVDSWSWGKRGAQDPEVFVQALKKLYEDAFPKGKLRNDISLVTYSGPIYKTWGYVESCEGGIFHARSSGIHSIRCRDLYFYDWECFGGGITSGKASHLYFGDLSLGVRLLTKKIKRHFGDERWKKILAIQVPHHGADRSWYPGAANEFSHKSSVYSYGLHNTYKHPGAMVTSDLHGSISLLVNQHQGAGFCGFMGNEPSY